MHKLILRAVGKRSTDCAGVDDLYRDENGNTYSGILEAIEAFAAALSSPFKGTVTIEADE